MAAHFAARLSLLAFAAVSLSGAVAGDDFDGTIRTALAAGAVFSWLGFVLGDLARRAVEEQVESEFNRWKAEQQGRLNRVNETQAGTQTGTRTATPSGPRADRPAATPRGGRRSANETDPKDRTDPTDQKNQREPRTGAAQAASKPAGKPAAQRGRA